MKIFEDAEKLDVMDERFYKIGENNGQPIYFPSVTEILQMYPKGWAFDQWLKDVGNNAKIIAERAAEDGSTVHWAINSLLEGNEISWQTKIEERLKYLEPSFSLQQWKGVCRFMDFYQEWKPETVANDFQVWSMNHKYAGTLDYVCKIKGETWLIDFKFANAVHNNYYLQLSAYAKALEEKDRIKVDRIGILHLKSLTRGRDSKGINIQGDGWKLDEPKQSIDHLFEIFKSVLNIYYFEKPNGKPEIYSLPIKFKL